MISAVAAPDKRHVAEAAGRDVADAAPLPSRIALVATVVPSRIEAISSVLPKVLRPVMTPSIGSCGVDRFFQAFSSRRLRRRRRSP